jgi:Zn-dependent metalloprotease
MSRPHLWTGVVATGCLVLASLATAGTGTAAAPRGTADDGGGGSVPFRTGHQADKTFGPSARRTAMAKASRRTAATAQALRLGGREALVVKDVMRDADGAVHVRYNRTYAGLPVIGGDLVVHQTPTGRIRGVNWASRDRIAVPSTTPVLARSAARGSDARLVVFAVHHRPVLAFEGHVRGFEPDGTPIDDLVYTDARTGNRLGVSHGVQTDTGTGKTLYSGNVALTTKKVGTHWVLTDVSRGGQSTYDANGSSTDDQGTLFSDTDNVWGTGAAASRQSAAADAHYGAAETWDFYKTTFGRNGIANNGVGAYSRVHFGVGYENAFWDNSCFCMTYGDGDAIFKPLVSLDVAGHEMSHGVTAASNGLDYFGDAGGLNESTSDVMGTMVEFYAANAKDRGDYYIGEKIMQDGTQLRRMDNPASDGDSRNCWSSSVKNLDPHFSSGVGNHLFYLLAEGSGSKSIGGRAHKSTTCNGTTVTGVGRTKAAAIWYRAMTTYWVSTETYKQAANSMVMSSRDLYGKNSTPCKRTIAAWKAVNAAPTVGCGSTPLPTGTSGNGVRNPGFESGVLKWTQSSTGLITDSTSGFPHRGSWYAYFLGWTTTHTDTVKQTFTVPAGGSSMLRFYLLVYTDQINTSAFDKLSVKVKSGTTTKTLKTYNNLDYTYGAYVLKALDLTAYHGKSITLSFVTNSNADANFAGFLLDDVSVVSTKAP